MYCKFCGATIADNSVFCNHCGKSQNDTGQRAAISSAQASSGLAAGIIVSLALSVAVIVTCFFPWMKVDMGRYLLNFTDQMNLFGIISSLIQDSLVLPALILIAFGGVSLYFHGRSAISAIQQQPSYIVNAQLAGMMSTIFALIGMFMFWLYKRSLISDNLDYEAQLFHLGSGVIACFIISLGQWFLFGFGSSLFKVGSLATDTQIACPHCGTKYTKLTAATRCPNCNKLPGDIPSSGIVATVTCPYCKTKYAANVTYCDVCNKQFRSGPEVHSDPSKNPAPKTVPGPGPSNVKKCPFCKTENALDVVFCGGCGAQIGAKK